MAESKPELVCTVEGCTNRAGIGGGTKTMCPAHYMRARRAKQEGKQGKELAAALEAPMRGEVDPMELVSFRVRPETRAAVAAEAEARGLEVGAVMREALEEWAERRAKRSARKGKG